MRLGRSLRRSSATSPNPRRSTRSCCSTSRGEVAEQVAAEHGGGRASAREADARAGLAEEIAGCDALINSASYRINLDAMQACLDAGCHYLDLGGLYHLTGEQLASSDRFEAAGLLAVLGIGSSPGKTNLMAARAVAELDSVDSIDVSAASRDLDPPPGLSLPYALETLIDELTLAPVVLRDGEPAEVEPLSDGGEVDFGEPIGVAGTIYTLHSELRTFGESFGCRECSFRLSLSPPLLEKLRELTGAGEDRVREAGREAGRQSPETVSVHIIDASGGGRSVRMRSVTPAARRLGHGRRHRLHRLAGGGGGAADRPRPGRRPRRASPGALPGPRGDVRRAGESRLSLSIGRQGGERRMKVGVVKEIKQDEYRVAITPAGVREMVEHGHEVLIETAAGEGSSIPDAEYAAQGAKIAPDAASVFGEAEMIVHVKELQPTEIEMLRPEQLLFTYLHLAPDPEQTRGCRGPGPPASPMRRSRTPAGACPCWPR